MKKEGTMKKLFVVPILSIFVLFLIFTPASVAFASPITKTNIIQITNQERVRAGLPILYPNYRLNLAAQNKANDMLANSYWEHYHNGKTPWDWMKEANYEFTAAGENLAIDFFETEPMVQAWMDSPTHRQNIINPNFRGIGVGIAKGYFRDHQTIIVVQMFGKPKNTTINYNAQIAGTNGFIENDEGVIISQNEPRRGFWANIWFKVKNFLDSVSNYTLDFLGVV